MDGLEKQKQLLAKLINSPQAIAPYVLRDMLDNLKQLADERRVMANSDSIQELLVELADATISEIEPFIEQEINKFNN